MPNNLTAQQIAAIDRALDRAAQPERDDFLSSETGAALEIEVCNSAIDTTLPPLPRLALLSIHQSASQAAQDAAHAAGGIDRLDREIDALRGEIAALRGVLHAIPAMLKRG